MIKKQILPRYDVHWVGELSVDIEKGVTEGVCIDIGEESEDFKIPRRLPADSIDVTDLGEGQAMGRYLYSVQLGADVSVSIIDKSRLEIESVTEVYIALKTLPGALGRAVLLGVGILVPNREGALALAAKIIKKKKDDRAGSDWYSGEED